MMSFEECQEWGRRRQQEKESLRQKQEQIHREELRKRGVNPDVQQIVKPKYDHPSMPEDSFVTVLYIIGMVGSLIFKDFWIAWIGLTAAYGKFITRHDND